MRYYKFKKSRAVLSGFFMRKKINNFAHFWGAKITYIIALANVNGRMKFGNKNAKNN